MHKFLHVEDYLEVVAGKKPLPGQPSNQYLFMHSFDPIISLARYDVKFLDSVTDATIMGTALSDRQAELAVKILLKYKRQLAVKGVDVASLTNPQYRKPLRKVDQTRLVTLEDDKLLVRFPFSEKMIQGMRDGAGMSQGAVRWNRDGKVWEAAPTEFNINWIVSFAEANQLAVDPAVQARMQEILDCEKTEYKIELKRTSDGTLTIENAPDSMLNYLQHLLEKQDVVSLVDMSGRLGFTVDKHIEHDLIQEYGIEFYMNLTARWRQLPMEHDRLKHVVDYALRVNKVPLYVYDPSAADSFEFYASMFQPGEVLAVSNMRELEYVDPKIKLVWTHKPLKLQWRIPVLISYVGLLIGGDKNYMLQNSDKVFFYCADVMKTK